LRRGGMAQHQGHKEQGHHDESYFCHPAHLASVSAVATNNSP
jgi:hypothetical protein